MPSQTFFDPNETPTEGTPAALRRRLRDKLKQMPKHVDANGNAIDAPPAIEAFAPPKKGVTQEPTRTIRDTLAGRPGWDVRP